MKKKLFQFLMGTALAFSSTLTYAQLQPDLPGTGGEVPIQENFSDPCGTTHMLNRLLKEDPLTKKRMDDLEEFTREYVKNNPISGKSATSSRRAAPLVIPVAVHIIYRNSTTDPTNLTDAQIQYQITALNDAFRKRNTDLDLAHAPQAFIDIAADMEIEFVLNSSNIRRVRNDNTWDFDYNNAQIKNLSPAININSFLNIWVCTSNGSYTGIADFPSMNPTNHGVIVHNRAFGTPAGGNPTDLGSNLGRTLVHEVGHWLNLRHIWGDEFQCAADDEVADTPKQKGWNRLSPSYPLYSYIYNTGIGSWDGGICHTPGPGDPGAMFMNYMDYPKDASKVMFTQGQKLRVEAALEYGGGRGNIACNNSTIPSSITIQGPTLVDCMAPLTYSTESLPNASYTWTLPQGWSIVGNANGSTIQVKQNYNPTFPATVSVSATSFCGNVVTRTRSLTITGKTAKLYGKPTLTNVPSIMCYDPVAYGSEVTINASHSETSYTFKYETYPGNVMDMRSDWDFYGENPSNLNASTNIRSFQDTDMRATLKVIDPNYSGMVTLKVYAWSPYCGTFSDPTIYEIWVGKLTPPSFSSAPVNTSAGSQFTIYLNSYFGQPLNLPSGWNWYIQNITPLNPWGYYQMQVLVTVPANTPNGVYYLNATTSNACGSSTSPNLPVCVGGGCRFSGNLSTVTIYPNPATDNINISIGNTETRKASTIQSEYRIFNHHGKQVKSGSFNGSSTSINTEKLNKGLYILHVINGQEVQKQNFLIE